MRSSVRTTVLAAATLLVASVPAAAQEADGTVTVVHAVPDVVVDVYVNGELTLEDFAPTTVTDPLTLPAGDYELEVYAADADPSATDPVIAGSTTLPAGANASVVAHPDADGAPTLGVFVNDTSTLAAGQARLTVRHTAAAPAVDVRAGGSVVFEDVSNGAEGVVEVPAGDYSADVVLAGTDTVAIGPADVTLAEGANTIVYAYGTGDSGYDLLVQSIGGLGSAPTAVPAGDGGLAGDDGMPVWVVALMVLGLALVARPALARSRR